MISNAYNIAFETTLLNWLILFVISLNIVTGKKIPAKNRWKQQTLFVLLLHWLWKDQVHFTKKLIEWLSFLCIFLLDSSWIISNNGDYNKTSSQTERYHQYQQVIWFGCKQYYFQPVGEISSVILLLLLFFNLFA